MAGLESKIYLIRGEKVMLDHDLAELYQVTKKRLREQVRRNQKRLPDDFMFILTKQEVAQLPPHFAASRAARGSRKVSPYVFTEHGVCMLSSILNSDRAIDVNIAIRELMSTHAVPMKRIIGLGKKDV